MSLASRKPSTSWSADELIPFGKYLLLERISSGATAAVFRAKLQGDGFERVVAIKRILPHMAGDAEFFDTFVREARTTARLTHENICPIYELGRVGESLYMAMENIAGKDLGRITEKLRERGTPMPPQVAAWIVARLCDALDYAHGLKDAAGKPIGIVHRDLSPANVVISYEGEVKLIDFGVAKAVGRAQQTNVDALKKKLGYMSPEMVKGRPLDARSDIFGVGVLLYEMVTERRLFAGKDDMATLSMVSRASVPPPSALTEEAPEELELIIMRALEREPEDRYQTAGDMAKALMMYVSSQDKLFGPRQLAAFMRDLFTEEQEREQARTQTLLEASRDPELIAARREFFSSASGAVAAARAQLQQSQRRITQERPIRRDPHADTPSEDTPSEDTPTRMQALTPTPTNPKPQGGVRGAAGSTPPVVAVEAGPHEEEATEIFFNKEHNLGLAGLSEEERPSERAAEPDPTDDEEPTRIDLTSSHPPATPAPATRGSQPPLPLPKAAEAGASAAGQHAAPQAQTASAPHHPVTEVAENPLEHQRRRQERLSNWMLAIGSLLLALSVGALLYRTQTPAGESETGAPAGEGTLEVRTLPPVGATIKLDGVLRGRAPLRITGVTAGTRQVELVAPGYETAERSVQVQADSVTDLAITLEPSADTADQPPTSQ